MLWTLITRLEQSSEWHAHAVFELVLCRSDVGCIEVERGEVALKRGRAILIAPEARHRYRLDPGEATEVKVVCLPPPDIAAFLSPAVAASLDAVRPAGITYADAYGPSARVMDTSVLIEPGLGTQRGDALKLAWGAIGLLLSWLCERPDAATVRSADRFQPVREWIDSHIDQDLCLDALAARFGMSRSLLSRGFRRHTGQSVVEYCNARRLERSARLLVASDEAVADIARISGYPNLSHYHRQFKAFYGLTPAAFRRLASGDARAATAGTGAD